MDLNNNFILENLDIFLKDSNFSKVDLQPGDVLFNEGDVNSNLYLIVKGKISIEKFISGDNSTTNKLAVLLGGDFVGEGSLQNNLPKEVKVVSLTDSTLLVINGKEGISNFIKKYPKEGQKLLTYIISICNKRLLDSNNLITKTYEINKKIINLEKINYKFIFEIVDNIKNIIGCDYVLFLEKNNYVNSLLLLKYDTRTNMKMLDIVIEKFDLSGIDQYISNNNYIQKLGIGNNILGYLIFSNKDSSFTERDKKVILSLSSSLSSILGQKNNFNEDKDIEYLNY